MYLITNLSDRDIYFKNFTLCKNETICISDDTEAFNHTLLSNCDKLKSIAIAKVAEPIILKKSVEKTCKPRKTKKGQK